MNVGERERVSKKGREGAIARRPEGFIANKIANTLVDPWGAPWERVLKQPMPLGGRRWAIRGRPCQPNAPVASDQQTLPCRYLHRVPATASRHRGARVL